ncbi:hypothetical protein BKA23_2641 [Rudaeicoccus suwonensis]|uniref:6-phosphogluconolactonase (Cycloisomerase 2 family) n=2 Tax=Rudaeicoccus suwonensis TaxID=657409 RepID=A0A561E3U5_9MICO|nr:hypothetical protein BKA23_2641 [Rudaeicoccus suwonensis]
MKTFTRIASTVGAIAATGLVAVAPANAATVHHNAPQPATHGIVFVQNNSTTGNTVYAYDRTKSGGLTQVGAYPTGGNGGALSGAVADHLSSEGSLSYDALSHTLYAVNAGSNTLTSFAVFGDHLVREQVVPTEGTFPVSVAVRGNLVFVLNARNGGSISGYVRVGNELFAVPSWNRQLKLNTSAPGQPNEFVSTPGQLSFAPNGQSLIVATKNGGNTLESFPLAFWGPSTKPVVTSLPGAVPFGFAYDARGHLVLSEPGTGNVVSFQLARNGQATTLDTVATGQKAPCWVASWGNDIFVSNAGSNTVSSYVSSSSGKLTSEGVTATDPGTVDATVSPDGHYLYVQTGVNGIVDVYTIGAHASLTKTGSVTVPNGIGAEGIVAL